MATYLDAYPSWSPGRHKPLSSTPSKCDAQPSSPIPIPRRSTARPPPCSPVRNQRSPELTYNFEFSISPDAPAARLEVLCSRGLGIRRPSLQQRTTHVPFSALVSQEVRSEDPNAREPFLYTIPKLSCQHARGTKKPPCTGSRQYNSSTKVLINDAVSKHVPSPASSKSSLLRTHPPLLLPKDVSAHCDEEDLTLTAAFRRPLASVSTTSNTSFRNTSPLDSHSPPHTSRPRAPHFMTPSHPTAIHRKTTAAPVISLSVAQAEPAIFDGNGRERQSSPKSGVARPRTRRSSSAGAERDLRRIHDSGRRMGTVVGRGFGRVVSMVEYDHGRGKSLVSDEDIESSLEKVHQDSADELMRGRDTDCGRRDGHHKHRAGGSPEHDRGRTRGRALERDNALPGWKWANAQ